METLILDVTQTIDDQMTTATTISLFPDEIIQEILSRLPIKPLLQYKSVSKQWLSLISHPSFAEFHFMRTRIHGHRTSLFVCSYDSATNKRHFLSAPQDGGPVTHLITLDNAPCTDSEKTTSAQHLNGLVLFSSNGFFENNFAFVINPATRKAFKLPVPTTDTEFVPCSYFFGFHQSRNEHCILSIRMPFPNMGFMKPVNIEPTAIEFMIYSLSSYSWRKIDLQEELPVDLISGKKWYYGPVRSVCVNSVIHLMVETHNKILAFDLRTETFSTINIPQEAIPNETCTTWFTSTGTRMMKRNQPYIIKINGLLGFVSHDRVVETNQMHIWILQDYDNRVWVRDTVKFSESWTETDGPYPTDCVNNIDEIVFSLRKLSKDVISVPIYDMKTRCFKSVQFTLGHQFLCSKTMRFNQVRSYVESICPLREE